MKAIFINSSVILLFFTQLIFSQEKDENSEFKNYSSSVFDKKETALSLISAASDNKETTTVDYLRNQNSVVSIIQIGDYNTSDLNIQSDKANIGVMQNGNYNEYTLVKSAKTLSTDVLQNGNNNVIDDYSYRTNYDVNTKMTQNGNNQNIKSIGTNSISKDMKVSQTGNGASVIILNKLN